MSQFAKVRYLVTDSFAKGDYGVAGIGVAFRGGRIVCGDIVEASDVLSAELLAVLRAVEIASRHKGETVVYTDHTLTWELATGPSCEGLQPLILTVQGWLRAHPNITLQLAPWEAIKSARIVARQTFKAWRCSFNDGVTWSAPDLLADPRGGDRAETGNGSSNSESADVAGAASSGAGAASPPSFGGFGFGYWQESVAREAR